jgi:hypothetical protein
MIRFAVGLLAMLAGTSIVQADEFLPLEGKTIALGDTTGIAYFTIGADGYEVVITLASNASATPVRFVASLISGQSIVVSVPRAAGEEAISTTISRVGDRLWASKPDSVASH